MEMKRRNRTDWQGRYAAVFRTSRLFQLFLVLAFENRSLSMSLLAIRTICTHSHVGPDHRQLGSAVHVDGRGRFVYVSLAPLPFGSVIHAMPEIVAYRARGSFDCMS